MIMKNFASKSNLALVRRRCLPFLKGELCLLRLLLFLAQSREVAEEDFFLAGLFLSASRCSFRSCSRFCFCKAIRCCCKERLGMSPARPKVLLYTGCLIIDCTFYIWVIWGGIFWEIWGKNHRLLLL